MLKHRKGFTLIELLIVVVIIGILAAIALPKFGSTREAAYCSTLKADLNNLRSAQEVYYTTGNYEYGTAANIDYSTSSGSTVTITLQNSNQGYQAVAEHAALDATAPHCALYYGNASAVSPATSEGEIACVAPCT